MNSFTPKFWYSGSKKWGIASDVTFIEERMKWLSRENQKIAAETYDEIYKHYINKKQLQNARYYANKMLNDFVNDYGVTKEEYKQLQASDKSQDWVNKRVEELKEAKKKGLPRITFEKRSRAHERNR